MIESGLILPIRFYANLTEQDRFKRHSQGVSLTTLNYPYVDCTTLAPFQLSYIKDGIVTDIDWYIICADTGDITELDYNEDHWDSLILSDNRMRVYYLGTDDFTGMINNGLHYFKVSVQFNDETVDFYSDLFMVGNCGEEPFSIDSFRAWQSPNNLRQIDVNDLRIY